MTSLSLLGENHRTISFSRLPEAYLSSVNKSNLLNRSRARSESLIQEDNRASDKINQLVREFANSRIMGANW
jgi:hypothetical protein